MIRSSEALDRQMNQELREKVTKALRIETSCDSMNFWTAWVEGTLDLGCTRGTGDSEEEAVAALEEKLGVQI